MLSRAQAYRDPDWKVDSTAAKHPGFGVAGILTTGEVEIMKIMTNLFALAIALSVMGLIIVAGYYGALYAMESFAALEYDVRVILFTASLSLILAALILALGFRAAGQTSARGRLIDKKQDLYAQILMIFRELANSKMDRPGRNRLIDELGQLHADLLTLASGAAIKAYMAMLATVKNKP